MVGWFCFRELFDILCFGLLLFNTIGVFGSNNKEGARCSGGTGGLLYLHFAYADGGLFRRVDVVDGGGGGTLFEVAETLVDAAKSKEGDNTDDAVGQDAKANEDAEEGTGGFGFAEGKEAQHDATYAQYEHQPPAVVAAFTVVDGEDGEGDTFEDNPHGEDNDEGHFGDQDVGGEHEPHDDLEHGQQRGGAGIGQKGLCTEAEDERRHAGDKDDQSHEPCRGGKTGTRVENTDYAQNDEQQGSDDEINVDSFHGEFGNVLLC